MIVSLPTAAAFEEVIGGMDGVAEAARPGLAVVETSTLPLAVKDRARRLLEHGGATLLDCPISGTGGQLRTKDVVVYASGDAATLERVNPVLPRGQGQAGWRGGSRPR